MMGQAEFDDGQQTSGDRASVLRSPKAKERPAQQFGAKEGVETRARHQEWKLTGSIEVEHEQIRERATDCRQIYSLDR